MTRLRTLLVTVRDPLEPPVQALARAASLARHSGARIELFHAVTGFAPGEATRRHSGRGPARSLLASVTETRRTQLEGIARHRVLRDLETSCHASWDSPPTRPSSDGRAQSRRTSWSPNVTHTTSGPAGS